jgi:hypothetical protein
MRRSEGLAVLARAGLISRFILVRRSFPGFTDIISDTCIIGPDFEDLLAACIDLGEFDRLELSTRPAVLTMPAHSGVDHWLRQ